ncbi:MAG: hypothetical protein K6B75_07880 [Lachnospiraceae bacterium]|nr:hypothetical protein [Lachnospiraceae bacterium]
MPENAVVEAGNTFTADEFLLEEGHTAYFSGDFAAKYVKDGKAVINHIGDYTAQITIDKKEYTVPVHVEDSKAPKAKALQITIPVGTMLLPEQCVTDVKDATSITYEFISVPDFFNVGKSTAVVRLTDEAFNKTDVEIDLNIISTGDCLLKEYVLEAGGKIPDEKELVLFGKTGKFVTDISVINTSLVGEYSLLMNIEGNEYSTHLVIVDTIPPTATVEPQYAYPGQALPEAASFVKDIKDVGPVSISYENAPEIMTDEKLNVKIAIEDQSGNKTVYESYFEPALDNEVPVINSYPEEIVADLGTQLIWRALVDASDNSGYCELSLDTSTVNLDYAGTYTAYIVAKDYAGNETRQKTSVILHDASVTKEMMDKLCEDIFAEILTDDMSKYEVIKAVWKYINSNISYTTAGVHDDTRREAYLALKSRKSGDCFSYCASAIELFSRLGIDTIMVVRDPVCAAKIRANHMWVIVNYGTEEEPLWYHFDAVVTKLRKQTYLMTNRQLKAFTNKYNELFNRDYFYTFDESLYPEIATEELYDIGLDAKYYE